MINIYNNFLNALFYIKKRFFREESSGFYNLTIIFSLKILNPNPCPAACNVSKRIFRNLNSFEIMENVKTESPTIDLDIKPIHTDKVFNFFYTYII